MIKAIGRIFGSLFSTYQGKLLATLFFFSALTFPLLTFNRVLLTQRFIGQRESNRIAGLTSILTSEFSENLSENDASGLEDMLAVVKALPKVDGISVLSPDGLVLFTTFADKRGKQNDVADSGPPPFFMGGTTIRSFPIVKNGQTLGSVQLFYSLREAREDMLTALFWSILVSLTILAVLMIISYFASRHLLKPLEQMVSFSEKIASGDFSARIEVNTKDIIGDLGTAMNLMAEKTGDLTANMNRRIVEATAHLEKQNSELHRLNLEKNEILGIAAHDLRNPISIIEMYSSFLINKIGEGDLTRLEGYLKVINESSNFMLTLLNDLLDLSVIESGKLDLKLTEVDLSETVACQVRLFQDLASRKGLSIDLSISEGDYTAEMDLYKIQQVISNLLDNAVKYSYPEKPIGLSLTKNAGNILIEIRNFGPPIPPQDISKLFKTFGKTGARPTGGEKSTGLGLAIAKKIVEGHGGKIEVESSAEAGTVFRISLPCARFSGEDREV